MSDRANENVNPYQSPEAPSRRSEPETLFDLHGLKSIRVAGSLSLEDAGKVCAVPRAHPAGLVVVSLFLIGVLALMGSLYVYFYYVGVRNEEYEFGGSVMGIISSCFLGFLAICGLIGLLLQARTVKRMWQQQRGMFAYCETTILREGTERKFGDATLKTAWNDYTSYGITKDLVVLRLRGRTVKRRRSQDWGKTFTLLERWLGFDWADLFPRRHFPSDAEWEFFVLLVKRTLRKA